MKQEIIEKLFDNKELTSEEILYIANNLSGDVQETPLPYFHKEKSITKACGLSRKDYEEVNDYFATLVEEQKDNSEMGVSEIIEKFEAFILTNRKYQRGLIIQTVMNLTQNPLPHILGGIISSMKKKRKKDEDEE